MNMKKGDREQVLGFSQKIKTCNLQPVTYNLNSGFGLLETVLALGLLVIVVAAAVFLANTALKRSQLNVIRSGAYQISKEQLELLRQIRDTNFQKGRDWNEGFPLIDNTNFFITLNTDGIPEIDATQPCGAKILNGTKYHFFLRLREPSSNPAEGKLVIPDSNYRAVEVSVRWNQSDTQACNTPWQPSQKIQVETFLTNWKRL